MAQLGINAQVMQIRMTQVASLKNVRNSADGEFGKLFEGLKASDSQKDSSYEAAIKGTRSDLNAKTEGQQRSKAVQSGETVSGTPQQERDRANSLEDEAHISEDDVIGLGNPDEQDTSEDSMFVSVVCTIMIRFAQILEVTTDELQGSFEQLSMDPRDIINGSGISQMVMSMNNIDDMSDLLMNTDMSDLTCRLTDAVSEVLDDFAMNRELFLDAFSAEDMKKFMADVNSELAGMLEKASGYFELLTSENGKMVEKGLYEKETGKPIQPADEETDSGEMIGNLQETEQESYSSVHNGNMSDTHEEDHGDGLTGGEVKEDVKNPSRSQRTGSDITTPFDRFVAGMEHAVKNSMDGVKGIEAVDVREIVYQLVDSIKLSLSPEKNSIELQLTPESLGKVQLNVSSKEGVMTAKITTENETARAAVEAQLETLKETINAQGFKVESIEVTVSSFSFADSKNAETDRDREDGSQKKRTGSVSSAGMEEHILTSHEGDREQAIMAQSGSTVSYVA